MTFQCQCRGFEVHVLVEKNLKKHQEPAKNIQEPLFRWVDLQWEGHLSKGWLNSHDLKTRSICSKCGNCPANQVWSQEDNAKWWVFLCGDFKAVNWRPSPYLSWQYVNRGWTNPGWWVNDILGKESENPPAPSFIRFPSKFIKLPHHRPYQRPFSQRPLFKTPLGFRDCPMCTTTRGCRPRGPKEAWSFFGANYISTGHPSTNTTITLETTGVSQGFMEAISIHFLVVLGRASPLIQRTWLWRGDHISHITFHS